MRELTRAQRGAVITGFIIMAIACVVLMVTFIFILPNQQPREGDPWPQVTRTVNGSPTVVQPEDLP